MMGICLSFMISRGIYLSFKRLIFRVLQNILISRTDDAATFEVELLDTMGCPTYDTCHGEDRCIDFLWQTNHLIDEATVEVKVGTSRLAASTMFLQAFDAFLLYELQEVILVFSTLFLGQFTSQTSSVLRHVGRSMYRPHDRYHR